VRVGVVLLEVCTKSMIYLSNEYKCHESEEKEEEDDDGQ
jgi:hypothetical protein